MLKTFKKKLRKSSSSDDQSLQLSAEDQAGGTLTKKKTNLKTKLEVIRKQMGGNLSSLLSRHHYVDVRDDYITRVMTSLDKMRKEGVGCDVIGAHSIVLSYNNVLYEICLDLEKLKKACGKEKTEGENTGEEGSEVAAETGSDEKEEEANKGADKKLEDTEDAGDTKNAEDAKDAEDTEDIEDSSSKSINEKQAENVKTEKASEAEKEEAEDTEEDEKSTEHLENSERTVEKSLKAVTEDCEVDKCEGDSDNESVDTTVADDDVASQQEVCAEEEGEEKLEGEVQTEKTQDKDEMQEKCDDVKEEKQDDGGEKDVKEGKSEATEEQSIEESEKSEVEGVKEKKGNEVGGGVEEEKEEVRVEENKEAKVEAFDDEKRDLTKDEKAGGVASTSEDITVEEAAAAACDTSAEPTDEEAKTVGGDDDEDGEHVDLEAASKIRELEDSVVFLIDFLYEAKIKITKENHEKIGAIALKCGFPDITAACDRFAGVVEVGDDVEKCEGSDRQPVTYEDQQLHLKLLHHFDQLRQQQRHTDCEVTWVSDKSAKTSFPAHRALLVAASSYFRDAVKFDVASDASALLLGDDVTNKNKLMTSIYTGDIRVRSEQKMLKSARTLGACEVVLGCGEILQSKLNTENCCKLRQLAVEYNIDFLLTSSNRWIAQHLNEVTKTVNYHQLDVDTVERILQTNQLNLAFPLASGEMVVFNAAIRWLEHDLENRKQFVERALSCVRYPLLSLEHLLNDVSVHPLVLDNDVIIARVVDVMTSKKSSILCGAEMRGSPCIMTSGGSAMIDDVTSETQDYTPVGYYNKASLYDCESSRFYDWCILPESRTNHGVVAIKQFVFIIGGYDSYSCISNEVYYLDVAEGKWHKGPNMKLKRSFFTTDVVDDVIYVMGGLVPRGYSSSVEKLNLKTMTWQKGVSMPTTRYRHGSCVRNGEIMISGGNEKSTSVYSYDCNVANGGWKELNSLNIGRDSHVMSCVNDVIICAGGEGIKFSVEILRSDTWETMTLPVMTSTQLFYPSHVVFDEKIYLLGGWVGENEPCDEVWSIDAQSGVVTKHETIMPIALGSAASCVVTVPESYWKSKVNNKF